MIKRVVAALLMVALAFSVLTIVPEADPVAAHKKWDCRVVGEMVDPMTGGYVKRIKCVCVEHQHGGSTPEGDSAPTGETPEVGVPEG